MDDFDEGRRLIRQAKVITVLTGAGISAESGIPTFRGKDGYWTSGSENYTPQDFARYAYFKNHPIEVLEWYRKRQLQISKAKPNSGHYALVDIEHQTLSKNGSFLIITQNIDDLHRKAGSQNIAEIHGNIFKFRCSSLYSSDNHHLKVFNLDLSQIDDVTSLKCRTCSSFLRPNVLWFDETYDPRFFEIHRAEQHFQQTNLFLVVGTTLQTTLPYLMVETAIKLNVPIIEVNPEPVLGNIPALTFPSSAGEVLPKLVET